uniref:Uncharacterized protein TCIL3000_11_14490 n=1 Tax=Trypanosoma congolense (strain IL3000) TaxID=1068625 RepID=G0V2R0_TRYCI|nr:unnamed protein product [Trypanosoma congolense IL3000]
MPTNNMNGEYTCNVTDKGLGTQLRKLSEILTVSKGGSAKWEERLKALQQLGLFAKADISGHREFMYLMSTFVKVPLQSHIEENRATLSSEACRVVALLAECSTNRRAWQAASEWFIPSLLKLTVRKKEVFVNSAVKTLVRLASTNSFGPRAFKELLRGCTGGHAATRRHSFNVLNVFLQHCQNNEGEFVLAPYLEEVSQVLRSGLSDADAITRKCARDCYWNFHSCEREAARVLFSELDGTVKRALMHDQQRDPVRGSVYVAGEQLPSAPPDDGARNHTSGPPRPSPVEDARPESLGVTGVGPEVNQKPTSEALRFRGERWEMMRTCLESSAWMERLSGVRCVAEEFPHIQKKEECAKLLIMRLCDSDFRVAQAAIDVLPLVSRLYPSMCRDLLPELITSLLINVDEGRGLSGASRKLLMNIIKANPVGCIIKAIYYELRRIVSPTLKVHALDYAKYLYIENASYFSQQIPVKRAVEELTLLIQSENNKNSAVCKAATAALTALYVVAKNSFIRLLLHHVSTDERETVIEALQLSVPHLEQDCRRSLLGQRLLPHPPPAVSCSFAGLLAKGGDGLSSKAKVGELQQYLPSVSQVSTRGPTKDPSSGSKGETLPSATRRQKGSSTRLWSKATTVAQREQQSSPNAGPLTSGDPSSVLPGKRPVHHDPTSLVHASRPAPVGEHHTVDEVLDYVERVQDTVDTRSVLDLIDSEVAKNPRPWFDGFNRLLVQLERLIPHSSQPDRVVRSLSLKVLHTLVGSNPLRQYVNRSLKRVLLLVRIGMDDVFPEVREDAMAVMHFILQSGLYPTDYLLNAMAMCLDSWLRGGNSGYCSKGWLILMSSVKDLIIQLGPSAVLAPCSFKEYAEVRNVPPGVVSEPVLRRVCGAVVCALEHNTPEVRLSAVVSCAAIWMAFGSSALSYFASLTAGQQKLVSLYFHRLSSERLQSSGTAAVYRDMAEEMQAAGVSYPSL